MSDDAPPPQSDSELIQVAAMLSVAAASDSRVEPLAKTARDIVLKSESAVAELFAGYLRSKQPPPTIAPVTRANPNEVALDLINQARAAIEAKK